MAKEKLIDGFFAFDSKETQEKLKAQKEREFPNFNTVSEGEGTILPQIKWEEFTRNETPYEIPVLAVKQGNKIKTITLASLYGKEFSFLTTDGKTIKVDNLSPYEIGLLTSERNARLMALIPDEGLKVNFAFLQGHYDNGKNGKNFKLLTISLA